MSTDNPMLEPADTFYGKTGKSEPIEPTVLPTVAEDQEPLEETEKLDNPEEVKAESEETESEDDEQNTQYIEIDGEEYELNEVKKWRNSTMMQSDYTKKTQALAEERKRFEAERDSNSERLLKDMAEASEMRDQLAVLVAEDQEIDWAELKVDDPEKYIELKERADKRKEVLEKLKSERETPADDPAMIKEEQGKLFAANPDWFDEEGKPTAKYSDDIKLMNDWAIKAGFTPAEFGSMTRARYLTTVLKAAKYDQLQEKGRKIKETREKVPVVTKPKAKKSSDQPKPMADVFYGT